jgi:hypothetical protein
LLVLLGNGGAAGRGLMMVLAVAFGVYAAVGVARSDWLSAVIFGVGAIAFAGRWRELRRQAASTPSSDNP